MSTDRFEFGDRVRHPRRPEWGVGSIARVEDEVADGRPGQRLSVRFTNAGLKTLHTAHAALERVCEPAANGPAAGAAAPTVDWQQMEESDWLGSVARRKVEEAMVGLPPEAADPFRSFRDRLGFALGLYRFDRSGRGLIDWAVAQTGLDDPLTRFTRHELEQLYDRWAAARHEHLGRLLADPDADRTLVAELVEKAPSPAREAVRRFTVAR
ncbi:MAG: DUF3553 domain-containing protein [Planctomycetota bacterium]|jgi:hypothetical protein